MSTTKLLLTPRQREIIRILAQFTPESPATAADISQELGVSSRTILREMPAIESWLRENSLQFIRKPGVGLALVGELDVLSALLVHSDTSQNYSKEDRRHRLLFELLSAQEPVKSQALTRAFQISEGTLVGDLNYATQWLSTYGVTLLRRPGLGIYLESEEPNLRHAIVGVLLEDLHESVIFDLLEGTAPLLRPDTMAQVADALTEVAKEHSFHYTDRGYLALSLYLAVSTQRIEQGYFCPLVSAETDLSEYPVATAIVSALSLPTEEIYWVARELVGAIQRNDSALPPDQLETLSLRQLVLRIIDQVERTLPYSFHGNNLLVEDLMRHMEPALCRLQMGIPVKNTHIEEIKTQYPTIYSATEQACHLLHVPTTTTSIPDSEVAFIAMHFCAAVERLTTAQRNIRAAIVCPTGVGMSRILSANLSKHFKQIEICAVVSAMRLSTEWLLQQNIDLVISTVKLTLDFPTLCVHPGLRTQDRLLISETCQQLASKPPREESAPTQQFHLRHTIDYIDALGQEILRLISRVTLHLQESVADKSQLIDLAAALFTQGEFAQSVIRKDLLAREAISETYIDEGAMLLLHCRTSAVTCCQLGYIRLHTPLLHRGKSITGAIVMLVHQNPAPAHIEMMGQISSAFLDNQGLYQAVQQGSVTSFAQEVEKILSRYYRKILYQLSKD